MERRSCWHKIDKSSALLARGVVREVAGKDLLVPQDPRVYLVKARILLGTKRIPISVVWNPKP